MADADPATLAELQEALRRLETRVARLETGGIANLPPPATLPGGDAHSEQGRGQAEGRFPAAFTRAAAVCFALVGALALRVAAQRGIVAPGVGTAIGLAYCFVLLWTGRGRAGEGFLAAHGVVLQVCAALLAPLVVVEMARRYQVMPAGPAAIVLGGVAFVATGLAVRDGRRWLAASALAASSIAVAAIGAARADAVTRAAVLVALAALALGAAHVRGWTKVRAAVLWPALGAICAAVGAAARPEGRAADVPLALLVCAAALWALVAASHLFRSGRLTEGEAIWLPTVSAWLCVTMMLSGAPWIPAALAIAAVLGAAMLVAAHSESGAAPGGLATAASLCAGAGLGAADPTGLGLAAAALAIRAAGRRETGWVPVVSTRLLELAAAVVALTRSPLAWPELLSVPRLAAGLVLGAGLVWVFVRASGPVPEGQAREWTDDPVRSTAPAALAAGLVVLFGTARAAVCFALGPGSAFQVATTAVLAVSSALCLLAGMRAVSPAWTVAGLAATAALALKAVLWDLIRLEGGYAVVSIVLLGAAFGSASAALRRRRRRTAPAPATETEQRAAERN